MCNMKPKSYQIESLAASHLAIVSMIDRPCDVLELGCSTGIMTGHMIEQQGCRVTAVEIDPNQAAAASAVCGNVIVADIGKPEFWTSLSGRFDYAIFADVLEHLADPWSVLKWCGGVLKDGGSVLATIPNVAFYQVRKDLLFGRFDYTQFGILDDTHLRFFTADSVRSLFGSAGYKIDRFARLYRTGRERRYGRLCPDVFAYQFAVQASLAWNDRRDQD